VLGFASYLAEQVPPGQPWREELDLIQEEAGRARDIVRDLLHFSRQREFILRSPISTWSSSRRCPWCAARRAGLDHAPRRVRPGAAPVEVDVPAHQAGVPEPDQQRVYVMRTGAAPSRSARRQRGHGAGRSDGHGHGDRSGAPRRIFEPFFTTKPKSAARARLVGEPGDRGEPRRGDRGPERAR